MLMQESLLTRLLLHFDVPCEHFNADDYLVVVESIKTCLADFNSRLYQNKINYEFVVLPSEGGSFRGVTGVVVKTLSGAAIIGGIISGAETDSIKGLIHGITGRKVDYYDSIKKSGELLVDSITGLFSTETKELDKLIPNTTNLDKALHAKTMFYRMCLKNHLIAGIGFTDKHEFPIQRSHFPNYISKDKIRPVDSEFILYKAIIVSPININIDRIWHFKDSTTGNLIKAHMGDEKFKREFLNGKYPLKQSHEDDQIIMLVEYRKQEKNGEVENGKTIVNTVYNFNENKLKDLPKDGVINSNKLPMDELWTE